MRFSTRQKYLLTDALALGKALEEKDKQMYRRVGRKLRWKGISEQLHFAGNGSGVGTGVRQWWWLMRVRFAPLYDLASALPYPGMRPIALKLAMKIGGEYRLRNIAARQWKKLATEARRNLEELLATLRATAEAMPDHVLDIQQLVKQDGLVHPVVDRLSDQLVTRARKCGRLLR